MSTALNMPALDDAEDRFPIRPGLRLMSNHKDDTHENTETLAPPTDPEPPTNVENEPPRRDAISPPAVFNPATADSVFSDAVKQIADAARIIREGREERLRAEEQAQRNHDATIDAIVRADQNQSRNYELLRDEIRHLKDSDRRQDERLIEGDKRFATIEKSIADLKAELLALVTRAGEDAARRIAALESDLAELRANAATHAR
jgi:hypothetical protein